MTEQISLGLPAQVCPPTQTQPYGLLSWVEGTLSLGHQTDSAWNCPTACKAHERHDLSGAFGPILNIIGYSCWTAFSAFSIWVKYTGTSLCFLLAVCKNSALKYQRMQQCYTWVLIYLLSLTLGHVDLDTNPGQQWLCIMTVLIFPSLSLLCDFASHS